MTSLFCKFEPGPPEYGAGSLTAWRPLSILQLLSSW